MDFVEAMKIEKCSDFIKVTFKDVDHDQTRKKVMEKIQELGYDLEDGTEENVENMNSEAKKVDPIYSVFKRYFVKKHFAGFVHNTSIDKFLFFFDIPQEKDIQKLAFILEGQDGLIASKILIR